MRKRFRSGVNIARTRSFPGADTGSDHDLLMMTFRLRLNRISKPKHTRLKFDLEKLKDPNVLETFREVCTSHHHEQRRYRHRFNDHHFQHSSDWNSQWDPWQTSSEEKKPGSLQKSLIYATKGEHWEKKDLSLKDLRNTRKWTTTSIDAWKRLNKTG